MNLPAKYPATNPAHRPSAPLEVVSFPKMQGLLAQAARLAAEAGLPPEAFAQVAWQAYVGTVPGAAERLAEAQFEATIEQLRSSGRLPKA